MATKVSNLWRSTPADPSQSAATRVLSIVELRERIFAHLPLLDLHVRFPLVCKEWKATLSTSVHIHPRLLSVSATPKTKVLANPALRVKIFLELDFHTLLCTIPKVCKEWKETVDGSIQLQRALFFQPLKGGRKVYHWANDMFYDEDTEERTRYRVYINPFFDRIDRGPFNGMDEENASWRRMLLTQPPTTRLFWGEIDGYCYDYFRDRYAKNDSGVTLLDLKTKRAHVEWADSIILCGLFHSVKKAKHVQLTLRSRTKKAHYYKQSNWWSYFQTTFKGKRDGKLVRHRTNSCDCLA